MRKATRKLITQGINVVLLLTTLFFGVWSTANVAFGFNVIVTYEIPPLGVRYELNGESSAWEKTGTNIGLETYANQLVSADGFTPTTDDYAMAINGGELDFYKDIDIVNIKVLDGTVVAHLGDGNFTWGGVNSSSEQVDVMTYYPGHYIKRWQDATYEYIQLSTTSFSGAVYIAPYYRGTFKAIEDTTTISETTILRSYAGVMPTGSKTIDQFRDYANNNVNNSMSIGDWRDFDFLCLYLIKYADYNSQTKVGPGITDLGSVQINGKDSAHATLLGRDGYIGTTDETSVWCLGLCDFWGNQYEFVDGITINNNVACVATEPTNYKNSAVPNDSENFPGYTNIGYTNLDSDGFPKATGYAYDLNNLNNQLIAFPTTTGGSNSTGLCDNYYQSTGARVVRRGGDYSATSSGAFCFACNNNFTENYAYISCRLLKQIS